ncbi:metal-dependent hydrolase, partial [Salmonella enterica subsp. enterica serovar Anatum]|nr:metal-dependent hydrolase [Salmonella enterica subsp. enterica serovar Anatum]
LFAGVVLAMLPDADVLAFKFGVAYGNVFGHRGFTHSLLFAFVILSKLDDERIKDEDVRHDGRHAHDHDYVTRVRDINADTPARY